MPQVGRARTIAADGVSVVLPTYQAARFLQRCLDALWAQSWEGALEVVIADGGSTDATLAIIAAAQQAGRPVRLLQNPARVQAAGLNLAAAAARHSLLVRCDAQASLPVHAIALLVEEHRQTPGCNVGGRQVAQGDGSVFGDAVAAVYGTAAGSGGAAYRMALEPVDAETVYLGSWPREDFIAIGGFTADWAVNEDTELNVRWLRSGRRVRLLPALEIGYAPRSRPVALVRQYARYGFWRARTFRRHGDLRLRQVAALGPLGGLTLALLGRRRPVLSLPWLGYLGLLLAQAAGVDGRPAVRAVAPVALGLQHLAWGIGFVAGMCGPLPDSRPHADAESP